ncbi:MAG: hypothetical protein Q9P01_07985 [Anaerolineae bacterium]|nr:hypothetical protein [Anaerolineae bacterium]MDQ7034765.1 hypothetical protein [Anaerolineae bacterium]
MQALLASIGNLTQLRELHLGRYWGIEELPAEIGNLRQLEFLHIGENLIYELPHPRQLTLQTYLGAAIMQPAAQALPFTQNRLMGNFNCWTTGGRLDA